MSPCLGVEPDVERRFQALVARVQACRRCPRMEGRRRVLGPANGDLRALAQVSPHSVRLREHVATPCPWNGRYLFPLYHPSPQVVISPTGRSLSEQEGDFRRLRALVDGLASWSDGVVE